jgi:hypothetical protein
MTVRRVAGEAVSCACRGQINFLFLSACRNMAANWDHLMRRKIGLSTEIADDSYEHLYCIIKYVQTIGKEVKPSVATVCVCALLLHVEHYNMFRPIWAIIKCNIPLTYGTKPKWQFRQTSRNRRNAYYLF